MKKLLLLFICILVTGCGGEAKLDIGPVSLEEIREDEVSLSLVKGKVSKKSGSFVLENKTEYDVVNYGLAYELEKKVDDVWHKINVEADFSDTLFTVDPLKSSDVNINWASIYGKLPSGEYRILKKVNIKRANNIYESFYIGEEFSIE